MRIMIYTDNGIKEMECREVVFWNSEYAKVDGKRVPYSDIEMVYDTEDIEN